VVEDWQARSNPVIDPQLLAILVCPETHEPLHVADERLVARLNREAAQGRLRNRSGQSVEGLIEGGLIREDGRFLFPIVDGIPVMLIDESIPLEPTE
jgi:uncharacterized protein YbaR (Trm112 family)